MVRPAFMSKPEITAYLKTYCGWSNGVRAVLKKYDLTYTEKDIKEGARALTGYTFVDDEGVFRAGDHDTGGKTILGQSGNWNGDGPATVGLIGTPVRTQSYDYDAVGNWESVASAFACGPALPPKYAVGTSWHDVSSSGTAWHGPNGMLLMPRAPLDAMNHDTGPGDAQPPRTQRPSPVGRSFLAHHLHRQHPTTDAVPTRRRDRPCQPVLSFHVHEPRQRRTPFVTPPNAVCRGLARPGSVKR